MTQSVEKLKATIENLRTALALQTQRYLILQSDYAETKDLLEMHREKEKSMNLPKYSEVRKQRIDQEQKLNDLINRVTQIESKLS